MHGATTIIRLGYKVGDLLASLHLTRTLLRFS